MNERLARREAGLVDFIAYYMRYLYIRAQRRRGEPEDRQEDVKEIRERVRGEVSGKYSREEVLRMDHDARGIYRGGPW